MTDLPTASTPPQHDFAAVPPKPAAGRRGRRRLLVLLLCAGLGVAAVVGGTALYLRMTGGNDPSVPTQIESFQSVHKTEEDWLLATILEDLSGMASFATTRQRPAAPAQAAIRRDATGTLTVSITLSPERVLSAPLKIEHSLWSPEDYADVASRLVSAGGAGSTLPTPAATDEAALLGRLLEQRADVIQDQNETLSAALRAQPADPRRHEEAALLLGAFALREAAGFFDDVRHTLCRMTAHLALARALRGGGPTTLSGRYAEVVLAVLAGRGADAERTLAELQQGEGGSEVLAAWRRVLWMRLTEDWRTLPAPAQGSLAERLAWLRAAERTLGFTLALQRMERAKAAPGPEADWTLILSRGVPPGVGQGVLEFARTATTDEALHVLGRLRKAFPSLAVALNEPAQPFLSAEGPMVLAWGTWAAMYQRHLLHVFERTESYYRYTLGIPEASQQFVAEQKRTFGQLTLFPVVAAVEGTQRKKPDPTTLDGAVALALRHPELMTAGNWWWLDRKPSRLQVRRRLPHRENWFSTGCVRGTSYDVAMRGKGQPKFVSPGKLKAIAPRCFDVALLQPTDGSGSVFGEREEYDPRVLRVLRDRAYELDPQAPIRYSRRLCDLDPGWCGAFGADCVNQRDDEGAVRAYERHIEECVERVTVSHNTDWIVRHYLKTGRRARARAIAEMARETGSASGFLTMAAFLEETGRFSEAEDQILGERRRYPEDGPLHELIGFYFRMARLRKVTSYEAKLVDAIKGIFPDGLEGATLASFHEAPVDGAALVSDTPSLREKGIRRNAVVVALDGWRVRSKDQYAIIRAFDASPDMRFIVWQQGQYSEMLVRNLGRQPGVRLQTHNPQRPGAPAGARP